MMDSDSTAQNQTVLPRIVGFNYHVTVTLESPLSVGAGGSSEGFADKSIVRDADFRLIIPGSHFKGRLRHTVEKIARAAGYAVCNAPQPGDICPRPFADTKGAIAAARLLGEGAKSEEYYCIVCQMFGAPTYRAPLHFADLRHTDDYSEATKRLGVHGLAAIRPGVSINRRRGVAEDARLFFVETSRPGASLNFEAERAIEGQLPLDEDGPSAEEYRLLLETGLKLLRQWGGGKTRGLGWAKLDFKPVETNLQKSSPAKHFAATDQANSAHGYEIELELTALSPLCLGERRPNGQFRASQTFIAGRTLRGAIAYSLNGNGQSDFVTELFGKPARNLSNWFGHAYPINKEKALASALGGYSYRAPVTARHCKNDPAHPIFDMLFDTLAAEGQAQPARPFSPDCPVCEGRIEGYSGWIAEDNQEGEYKSVGNPESRMLTRVGINRKRGAAEDGLLYSPIVLNEGTTFRAIIRLATLEAANRLLEFLSSNGREFRVGSGISRGLGLVKVTRAEPRPYNPVAAVKDVQARVKNFNAALHKRINDNWIGIELPATDTLYLTVNLLSELKLSNPLEPFVPDVTAFGLDSHDDDITIERVFVNPTRRGGWDNGWGLPQDVSWLVAPGSLYVLKVNRTSSRENGSFYEQLAALERNGLGDERHNGYGRLRICEPFHSSHLWEASNRDNEQEKREELRDG
jgi:CRISPR-associated protein Csx10